MIIGDYVIVGPWKTLVYKIASQTAIIGPGINSKITIAGVSAIGAHCQLN